MPSLPPTLQGFPLCLSNHLIAILWNMFFANLMDPLPMFSWGQFYDVAKVVIIHMKI